MEPPACVSVAVSPPSVRPRRGQRLRDPEVGDERVPLVQQHVLGLDVAVHDAVPVRVVESGRDLARESHRVGGGHRTLTHKARAERFPAGDGHHVEQRPVGFSGVVKRHDVRVIQRRGDADLSQEPLGADSGTELRVQHLDRDVATVSEVVREVHRRHAAASQLALDAVAAGERGREPGDGFRHRCTVPLDCRFTSQMFASTCCAP